MGIMLLCFLLFKIVNRLDVIGWSIRWVNNLDKLCVDQSGWLINWLVN